MMKMKFKKSQLLESSWKKSKPRSMNIVLWWKVFNENSDFVITWLAYISGVCSSAGDVVCYLPMTKSHDATVPDYADSIPAVI